MTPSPRALQTLVAAGMTDAGRLRSKNEDAFLVDQEAGLFAVADGMGGHRCGEVASTIAVRHLPQLLDEQQARDGGSAATGTEPADAGTQLEAAVSHLSRFIHGVGRERRECHGMGTTLVVAWFRNRMIHVAHMGDSRAYLYRKGTLDLLTQDHSVVNMLVQLGALREEEAEGHPALNQITRFAGTPEPHGPDVRSFRCRKGDRVLLCSDGLWGCVPKDTMAAVLESEESPAGACRTLLALANAAGGPDNITAVVVDVAKAPSGKRQAPVA